MRRVLLSFFLSLLWAGAALGQPILMPAPQSVDPPFFLNGWDASGNVTARQPVQSDIQLPYGVTNSFSTAFIGQGQMFFVVADPSIFAVGYGVQVTLLDDPTNWVICIVSAIDSNAGVTCNSTAVNASNVTGTGFSLMVLQGPTLEGVPVWAGLGVDGTDSITVPSATGVTVSMALDAGKTFIAGDVVYVWAPQDAVSSYFVASVLSYNSASGTASVFVTQTSNSGKTWQLYYVSKITALGPFYAVLGYSGASLTFGSGAGQIGQGQVVTMTTQTGLLLNNSHVIVSSSTDSTKYFRAIGQYNSGTGAITLYITDSNGSGTFTSWSLLAQDGPPINASQIAVSKTSLTIGPGDTPSITVQAGQNMPLQGPVTLTALADPTKQMLGVIKAYSGASMIVTVTAVYGSGTFTAWSILNTGPPQSRISKYQMDGLLMQAGGFNNQVMTIQPGGVRSSDDTVDLILPSQVQISVASADTSVFQVVPLSGTISVAGSSPGWMTITGTSTAFSTDFSAAGTSTDLTAQLATLGFANITAPVTFSDNTGLTHYVGSSVRSVASNTSMITEGSVNVFSSGQPYNRGATGLGSAWSLFVLAMKDADGSTGVFISSFTVSGNPDLPSGYTKYRVIGIAQGAWGFGIGTVMQPLKQAEQIVPKAWISAVVTPTALGQNVTAVDTANDFVTFGSAHGLLTGTSVCLTGAVAAGLTTGTCYYIRALSQTTLAFYTSQAAAYADSGRVNITGATTGWSFRVLLYTNVAAFGFDTNAPIGANPGTTTMHFDFNLVVSVGSVCMLQANANGFMNTTPTLSNFWMFQVNQQSAGTLVYSCPSANLLSYVSNIFQPSTNLNQGTWGQQAANPFVIEAVIRSN